MNIYFSGSIRGGQDDVEIYNELITELKNYGNVLTEHIGCKIQNSDLTDEEIHDRDLKWVIESDVIVAEVTMPSLGVGYELGRAVEMNKPIICLSRTNGEKQISAMIAGCSQIRNFSYNELKEAKLILKEQFRDINKDWKDISYLRDGSDVQVKAFDCLTKLGIFESLAEYNPVLTGTIPIDIPTKNSDLDIACRYFDADRFERVIDSLYNDKPEFSIEQKEKAGYWVVVANFKYQSFNIEIYGSLYPVTSQNSYRHMLLEDRILKLLDPEFKKRVLELKNKGKKTEPAFAELLGLEGNPFVTLLKLEAFSDTEIKELWIK